MGFGHWIKKIGHKIRHAGRRAAHVFQHVGRKVSKAAHKVGRTVGNVAKTVHRDARDLVRGVGGIIRRQQDIISQGIQTAGSTIGGLGQSLATPLVIGAVAIGGIFLLSRR